MIVVRSYPTQQIVKRLLLVFRQVDSPPTLFRRKIFIILIPQFNFILCSSSKIKGLLDSHSECRRSKVQMQMAAGAFSFANSSILPRTSQSSIFNYHLQQSPRPIISLPLGSYHRLSTSLWPLQRHPLKEIGLGIPWDSKEEKGRLAAVQTSAVRQLTGSLTSTEGLRFGIVVARFNEIVTRALLEGALDTFNKYSVKEEDIDVVWVPGSFEIGVVAEKLGKSKKYQAIVCIGAVIRGDTTHYDAVANSAASGVLSAGLNSGVPCVFGVLTCDNMDQALNRAGGKSGNKGAEAALTAIEMASLFEHHLKL